MVHSFLSAVAKAFLSVVPPAKDKRDIFPENEHLLFWLFTGNKVERRSENGQEQCWVSVSRMSSLPGLLHRKHMLGAAGNSDTYGMHMFLFLEIK